VSDPIHHLDHLDPPLMHDSKLVPVAWALCAIGAVAFAACFFVAEGGASRAWSSLLAGLMLPLWLAIGSLFFLAVHALCGARWTVPLQNVMQGVGAGLPLAVLAFLALVAAGLPYVYDWANAEARTGLFRDPHGSKAAWMVPLRWSITGALILSILVTLQRTLALRSVVTDEAARDRLVRASVLTLIVLVPASTLLMWDLLLSLHVQWVSAVFGGYCLIQAIHAFLGCTALALVWLGRKGLSKVARPHLLKDVGTWLVAWSCIVAYISYIQYVIIGFANIDEETFWYLMRVQHGYGAQYVADITLRCIVPFVLLMSQSLRAKPWALGVAGASVLLGTWLELHWLIVPAFSPNHYRHPVGPEAMVALGLFAGSFLLAVRYWRRRGLVPHGDPRLLPAINAEHLH
jgi:hypothetical protein